jgi:hypothetical protein
VANVAGQTTPLGLTNAAHTRADGYRYSIPKGLTPTRYVWGHSERYDGSSVLLGRTPWIYDLQTSTYTIINFSATAVNNHWAADISEVDENSGRVFGAYHDGDGSGYHAFAFQIGGSAVDLDTLVEGDIGEDGLQHFISATFATPNGYVAGRAALTGSSGHGVYLVKRVE